MSWKIYVLHFNKPYKHARHYTGIAQDVEKRIERHRKGQGAKLTAVLKREGITFVYNIIAEYPDFSTAHAEEKRLKNKVKNPNRFCPICKDERRKKKMNLNHECPECHKIHEQKCVPSNDGKTDNPCDDCQSQIYTLSWMDSYNTFNWRDENIPIEKDLDSENGVLSKSGIKNLKESHPIFEIDNYDNDGWVDCTHVVKFKANNIEEVKTKVRKIFENNGRNIDVWSVYKGKESYLTEEDFD